MFKPRGQQRLTAKENLSRLSIFGYSIPVLPIYFLITPIGVVQSMYAKYFGLSLTTIASVLLIARLFDAVSDPLIGIASDYYNARRFSRKPFILIGGLLFVLASWFLYLPFGFQFPYGNDDSLISGGYFLGWFLAYYFAFTLFEIPHLAWASTLTINTAEKTKVYGMRSFYGHIGPLVFYALPLLPIFYSTEITPQTLKWAVLVSGIIMIPALLFCVFFVPDPPLALKKVTSEKRIAKKNNIVSTLHLIFLNKPLTLLLTGAIFMGFAGGMWGGLLFFFVDAYLVLGEKFAHVMLISITLSILSLKFWGRLASMFGKQITWCVALTFSGCGMIANSFLSPEDTSWLALLMSTALIYMGTISLSIVGYSLLSDVIDYGRWKFKEDQSAMYFSLMTLISKIANTLGGATGLAITALYDFDPTLSVHDKAAQFGLYLSVSWIPSLLIIVSIIFVIRVPITARHHSIIIKRLESAKHSLD